MDTIPTGELKDYSPILGGPLYQLFRRAHLTGDALELLSRRILVITLFAWLPLFFLALIEGRALAGSIRIPFLHDVEVQARFLVALPTLILAEVVVHRRITPLIRRFVDRRIILDEDLPRFRAAVESALRIRNSVALEVMLLVLVYTGGIWLWYSQIALGQPTWYATPDTQHMHLTLAGYWYAFVSIPLFQFILLRWYMRLVIWFRLLWQISRLNLHLTAAHPDKAGGIGFLGKSAYAFAPILFAEGALLSGLIASRVLYEGKNLLSFKMDAAGYIAFFVFAILGPLVMFTPQMDRARRAGSAQYGLLANRYLFRFEDKWIRDKGEETAQLLGTADIQALADLGNSFSLVRQMRLVPFGLQDITRLAATTAAPLVPLGLTIFSAEELLTRVLKLIFR